MRRPSSVSALRSGLPFVGLLCLAAVVPEGTLLPDPNAVAVEQRLRPPSLAHPFGTDALGRDVLARVVRGARVSLLVGLIAVGIAVSLGTTVGLLAGYLGGWTEACLMRFVDMMLAFPTFFLILTVVAFLEPSLRNMMIVIGLTSWMSTARLVRGEVLRLRELDYVAAARAMGASAAWVLRRHVLPGIMPNVLVAASLGLAWAMLTEAGLSFIGLGVQPPTPSWGNMLADGRAYLLSAWWLTAFPGAAIVVAVLGFSVLGEGLRSANHPSGPAPPCELGPRSHRQSERLG